MSRPYPEDDQSLTDFLQHHRPAVPPASADLEDRLMATILDTPQVLPLPSRSQQVYRRVLWLLPTAFAAGLVAIVGVQKLLTPQPSEAQLAELETFIESTWHLTPVAEQSLTETDELYPWVDVVNDSGVN